MLQKLIRWHAQTEDLTKQLQWLDAKSMWQPYTSHPLRQPDFTVPDLGDSSSTIASSKGFRTAQYLLSHGYKYANRYEFICFDEDTEEARQGACPAMTVVVYASTMELAAVALNAKLNSDEVWAEVYTLDEFALLSSSVASEARYLAESKQLLLASWLYNRAPVEIPPV